MESLFIEETRSTPRVDFNPENGLLTLHGQSYPENAFKFYEPIFNWVDQFLVNNNLEILIEFNLPYVNTSSSKCIMMLLEKFEEAYENGKKLKLYWYYDAENEFELECAEEFKEDTTFPFHIIPLNE